MFKPGETLRLHVIDNGDGVTVYHNMKVIEYNDGLVKVDQHGKVSVYNMRSRNFVKAEKDD